jgi:hypothetical protein
VKTFSLPYVGIMERSKTWGKTSVITLCIIIFAGFAAAASVDPGLAHGEFPVWFISVLGIFGLFVLFLVQRR